jgi:ABC1 atypical kinase-like domain
MLQQSASISTLCHSSSAKQTQACAHSASALLPVLNTTSAATWTLCTTTSVHTVQISEVFSEIADEPAGAASLAQVYRAVLRDTGDVVAVKIQRPGLLPIITRDLYVMKKAVEVHLSQYICCSRTGSCRSHVSVTCSTTGNCCQTSYYCHYIGILSVFTVLAYILYFADRWQQPRMLCR